jgi:CDP-glucose 4,6-dehydratase
LHESIFLGLDSQRAHTRLSWQPRLRLQDAVRLTIEWYREALNHPSSMYELTVRQLHLYEERLRAPAGPSIEL